MKNVVTSADNIEHDTGSVISGGVFSISTPASLKVNAGGNGIRKGTQLYSFSGGSASGFVPGSVMTTAPQSLNSSAQKVKVEGSFVVLDGDTATMIAQGTIPPPTGGTAPVSGGVKISAGQSKVKAN